jgi:hypothetical protein
MSQLLSLKTFDIFLLTTDGFISAERPIIYIHNASLLIKSKLSISIKLIKYLLSAFTYTAFVTIK